ncbi:MAG: glutaredoxin domain-containing protein [Bacteroidales bacterium]|jgi:glutaredoxin-like YruB-family protein|nr:hypothetical protein [Bacteroidales bacterium]MCK9447501.1 hypothetical protein [Bacteroidales bacterium]MDD3700625.1 glutaredoxin domain-containing protein [Bacteroidales bacterium]MDY0368252.1 glutaredoxin domain-containing protein [Bacteroidales bacterium]
MAVIHIDSHEQMLASLKKEGKNYVLIYKSGSESGKCSFDNVNQAAEKLTETNVLLVDVAQVRDVHPHYNITTSPTLMVFEGERFVNVVKGCNNPDYYIALFEESYFHPMEASAQPKQKRVTVYSTPSCSWCNTLKSYLRSNRIQFTDVDVSKNQQAAEQMVRRSGQQGVPQTDIEGQIVVGFDKNKINTLLGIQQNTN